LDLNAIQKSLNDPSHHVRVMAAWILYRGGDKQAAADCWNELLRNDSYAALKILNVIDWIGEGTQPYAEAIRMCQYSHGRYVDRMREYFDLAGKPAK